jgi:uncharacterized protein (TIGR00369 family)
MTTHGSDRLLGRDVHDLPRRRFADERRDEGKMTSTNPLIDLTRNARESGDLSPLVRAIPYSDFLGFSIERREGELIGKLAFSDHLIGNAFLPALHGGTVGALLESTAIFAVLLRVETMSIPKTISVTFDYLRSARALDTYAVAEITRLGRRVANVRAVAWKDDRAKPVAAANAHFLLLPAEDESDSDGR